MAEDDCEWVLESIVGYLGSPEWVIPVTDFIENKCTGKKQAMLDVFDARLHSKASFRAA